MSADTTPGSIEHINGCTPLHAAAYHGDAEVVDVLLRQGASVTARDEVYCGTPAGWANHARQTAIRDRILQGPIDLFDAIEFDLVDRIPGIVTRDPQAIERPFDACVPPYAKTDPSWMERWYTPLVFAVMQDKIEAARALMAQGANRAVGHPDGRSLVELARAKGLDDIAQLLTS